jgi:hypothetical protein
VLSGRRVRRIVRVAAVDDWRADAAGADGAVLAVAAVRICRAWRW